MKNKRIRFKDYQKFVSNREKLINQAIKEDGYKYALQYYHDFSGVGDVSFINDEIELQKALNCVNDDYREFVEYVLYF